MQEMSIVHLLPKKKKSFMLLIFSNERWNKMVSARKITWK